MTSIYDPLFEKESFTIQELSAFEMAALRVCGPRFKDKALCASIMDCHFKSAWQAGQIQLDPERKVFTVHKIDGNGGPK